MAIGIVGILFLYVLCTGKCSRKIWKNIHDFAYKRYKKRNERKDGKIEEQETNNKHDETAENKNASTLLNPHLSVYEGTVLLMIVIVLTGLQIVMIPTFKHNFKRTFIENLTNSNESLVYKACNVLQRQYLGEELIYAVIALIVLFIIFITHRSNRFSNYIMIKYKFFFKNKVYQNVIEIRNKERKKVLQKKLVDIYMSRCQRCRYKTKANCFCKFISCFFCCTCYDRKKKEKDSSSILRILKLLFCIDLWCCVRGKIIKKMEREEKKENDRKAIELEINEVSQEWSNNQYKWPIPLLPYSTRNRLLSVAVYVVYIYDILNILTYLYSSFLNMPQMQILKNIDGILKDFLMRILHVIIISLKFYPILAVVDIEPHVATSLICFIYIFIMLSIKLVTSGFCSEAFEKFSIEQIENQVHNSKFMRWSQRLNLTNLFETDETEESRYRKIVNDKIPALFEKFFGPKAETIASTPSFLPTLINQSMNVTVSRSVFREKIANKTVGILNDLLDGWNEEETDWSTTVRNLIENLPLYISLSFLLARFLVTFVQLSIKFLERCYIDCKKKCLSAQDQQSLEALNSFALNNFYANKYGISKNKTINHNYDYVKNILSNIHIFEEIQDDEKEKLFSLVKLNKLKKIYSPVRHFRFSKQVVNTFMIAFILLYFFTVFILRTSTVFGAWLVRRIQLLFQIIFGNVLPSFSFRDHNLSIEITAACLITSLICFIQLYLSLRSFQKYVLQLHKGGELSNKNMKDNAKSKDLFPNLFKKDHQAVIPNKSNLRETMVSHSLHYPGYLIAYLTNSYFLMFAILFIFILVCKLIWYVPQAIEFILQIVLQIALLYLFRLLSQKALTRYVIQNNDSNFITNLTPYFVISYFNFFFDYFNGFVACMIHVWKKAMILLFYLPRLDKAMFSEKDASLLKQLDKGHLAYLNFVHMEHMYNNPILITFSDILVEMMFISYIKKSQLKAHIKKSLLKRNSKNNNEKRQESLEKLKSKTQEQQEQNKATNEDDKYLKSINVDFERRQNFIESQISEVPDENSADMVANFDSKKGKLFEQQLSLFVTKQPENFELKCTENADDDDDDDAKLKSKLERQATIRSVNGKSIYEEKLIETSFGGESIFIIPTEVEEVDNEIKNTKVKKQQERFKYQSYRRLCNIFYLYVLLKENRILCNFTAGNMIKENKTNIVKKQQKGSKSESFRETLKRIRGSSDSSSRSSNSEISTPPRILRRQSRTDEKSYSKEAYFEDDDEDDENCKE